MNLRSVLPLLASLAAFTLPGCGGGGSSPAPVIVQPALPALAVTGSSPAAGAVTGIDAAPSITFDDTMSLNGVSGAISLSSAGGSVGTIMTVNGNSVSVTPEQPLVWGARYQLVAGTAVTSVAGRKLGQAFSTSFDTRDPAWSAPALLHTSLGPRSPRIAVSPNGTTAAVWTEADSDLGSRLMAARLHTGNHALPAPVALHTKGVWTSDPDVAVNDAGAIIVVWNEKLVEPYYFGVMMTRFDPAKGSWSTPLQLSRKEITAAFARPRVALDSAGNAVVVWRQYYQKDPGVEGIEATAYTAASGTWSPVQAISSNTHAASFAHLAMDARGNALVAWSQAASATGAPLASAARYDGAARRWSAAKVIETGEQGFGVTALQVDDNGNALVLMARSTDGTETRFATAYYSAASAAWQPAQAIEAGPVSVKQTLAMNAQGHALLVWTEETAAYISTIHFRRWDRTAARWSTGAGNPPSLAGGYSPSSTMVAALDPAGNAVLSWMSLPAYDRYETNSARYSAASGAWTSTVVARSRYLINDPVSAMDRSGQLMMLVEENEQIQYNAPTTLQIARLSGK